MATPVLSPSAFTTGEVSPSLFGNTSLARMHAAASTMRNFFVRYSGGAYSRAGTALVGISKQTGRSYPPRLITFQFSINQGLCLEFGHFYLRVISNGAYVTEAPVAISGISRSNPGIVGVAGTPFVNGDWVFISGVLGMSEINNVTYIVGNVGVGSFQLFDAYGSPVNTSGFGAYVSGGTAARIYTHGAPYAEQDLKYMKFTQSADVMSICCVNQQTNTEYLAQDLSRISDTNWVFTPAVPAPSVSPPTSVAVAVLGGSGTTTTYEYVVTAVSPSDGTESIASPIGTAAAAPDIAAAAGTVTVGWPVSATVGVSQYNIYKATVGRGGAAVPPGVAFGYAGTAYGVQFMDNNIIPDFTQVPPLHKNPFARGQVLSITITAPGALYTTATISITTGTGAGAVIVAIVSSGGVVGYFINDAGHDYKSTDTVVITGDGAGATATLQVGPQTGTYPAVVAYFQQRRAYAYTINQPDTYFMSQPGAFTNFDSRVPPIASDAIIGTPWSQEVNGIQFMVPVSGGLIAMTGLEAYLVTGTGGNVFTPQPISPSSQQAQPEGFNGCSPTIPPIRIYQDIIYVQAKGSTYRDFAFDIQTYTYTGVDLTLNSSHLFAGFTFREHAWCEEPFKVLWAVREDGVLLSLTYQKSEKIAGWGRHDTNGQFLSVCSVTEPPVDALYLAASRPFNPLAPTYTVERMNNRLWSSVEDAWCVDCGLTLAQLAPITTLSATLAVTYGAVNGFANLVGGSGYSVATVATIIDAPLSGNAAPGPGSGATAALTIVAGAITNVTFPTNGVGYINPQIVIYDPAGSEGGSGASLTLTIDTTVQLQSSGPLNTGGFVGKVLRMGGGVGVVTGAISTTLFTAAMTTPFSNLQPNGGGVVQVAQSGDWTISAPIQTVNGLRALAGQTVTGLADGKVITPRVVSPAGQIILDQPASAIIIGLAFQAQLQSTYLDGGEPTVQGQRKKIPAVTARIESSGQFKIGSNQPDGSTLSPPQIAPTWSNLADALTGAVPTYSGAATPLFTGDVRIPVQGGFQRPGQVCIQQDLPLPVQVLAFVSEVLEGDNPAQAAPNSQK